ncbi:MAG: helix-turn-helix domain-containing protein [Dysgonamonadaceae bacterium]|jgi:transcriptional regulator with XRE-family HTH domain|nr:helix-turn-helix domain-containing protein [Dysgonamonadaceae bacterium]
MSDFQKNIISRLLKENGKTKRELAVFLNIHENGINRLIGNNKISMERLDQIAQFLNMNIKVLFDKIYPQESKEPTEDPVFQVHDRKYSDTEEIILLLSDIIKGQKVIKEIEEKNANKLMEVLNFILTTPNH